MAISGTFSEISSFFIEIVGMKELRTCVSLLEFRPSRVFRANLAPASKKSENQKIL